MPRRNALTGLTVAQVFNEAQRVTTPTGLLRYARVLWDLFSEDEEGTLDQLLGCVVWVLKAEEVGGAPQGLEWGWPSASGSAACPLLFILLAR